MEDIKSMERFQRENLSNNEKQTIFNLDYDSYFNMSVENLLECDSLSKDIFKVTIDYETTAKLLKNQFINSTEADDNDDLKVSFGANIKQWFVKVWATIISIFQNITYSIINMIKALILYIQKKRTINQSMYKLINDTYFNVSNGFHTTAADRFTTLANEKNKFFITTKDTDNTSQGLTFSDIHARINDSNLHSFIYDTKIILKNKKSLFNLDTLKTFAKTDLAKESSEESLSMLEANVKLLAAQGIIAGEVSANVNTNMNKYIELVKVGNKPKHIANLLTYGSSNVTNVKIPTIEFLGLSGNSSVAVTKLLRMYLDDSKKIIGNGGYIDVIVEVLKKYKEVAANEAKTIKEISNYISSQLPIYDSNKEILGKFKRFTNMIVSIKTVKVKFIALRQGLIGNLLTMYSIMDNSIKQLLTASDSNIPLEGKKGTIVVTDTPVLNKKRNNVTNQYSGFDGDVIEDYEDPIKDLYVEGDESLKF